MLPTRTTYHIATAGADYKRIHAFFRAESARGEAEGLPPYQPFSISFPSVYGLREGQIVGVMASQLHPEYGLVVSPLHVAYSIKNHVPTVIRLTDCYEAVLADGGIEDYLIVLPSWKPSKRIFSSVKEGKLIAQLPHRLELYLIQVGI